MEEEKNLVGRPLLFKDPEQLKKRVDEYFVENTKWTLAGLAEYLDIDRQTLYNYKERNEYFDILKKATEKVEARYEERLVYENSPTGVIFALKNMGWKDQSQTDITSGGEKLSGFNYLPPQPYETK